MTTVINLLGGSGLGKSTTAAFVFGELKLLEKNVELVQEYAKEWAWAGRKIKPEDQDHICDEQWNRESRLYGKVDFIITDSPLLLGPMYQKFYGGNDPVFETIIDRMSTSEANGVKYMNFMLKRNKEFNPKGRFETAEQARQVDNFLQDYLNNKQIPFHTIVTNDRERVQEIVGKVLEHEG